MIFRGRGGGSTWIRACNIGMNMISFMGYIFSIFRFKVVISFIRSFGGTCTWYMYTLASICDFCIAYTCSFELSPTLTLPTCEQRSLCRDLVCAQVSKIYMKTELQCVPSRPCRDVKYFIFHLPVSLRLDGPLQWPGLIFVSTWS